ncbi:MAG: flagellar hook-length control protein FliK [Gammaproteobacteria bacterium]|nr:flagellar hook-length control protein FliK [Gammaproteobacteria bacterium]
MNPLSRVQPANSNKADTTGRESNQESSGAKEFGDHLDRQIEQSGSLKKSKASENSKENQVVSDDVVEQGEPLDEVEATQVGVLVSPEAEFVAVEAPPVMTSEFVSQQEAGQLETLVIDPQQGLQPVSADADENLQVVVPDGKTLPPVATVISPVVTGVGQGQGDEPVMQVGVKPEQVKIAVDTGVQSGQLKVAQSTTGEMKPSTEVEAFVAPELKLNLKNAEQGFDKAMQARAEAAVVSKINRATLAQQVPATTPLSTLHAQASNPVVENGTSALPTLSASITAPLQSPAWPQNVAERVNWMLNGNFQNAEIKLNPAHLGPMEIKLSVQDDKASIVFVSSHAPVREALDAALPRLREMLEQQGMSLADVDVSDHSSNDKEQTEGMTDGQAQPQSEKDGEHNAALMGQSVIRIDVSDGISIYA